jgi:hypothetical protein
MPRPTKRVPATIRATAYYNGDVSESTVHSAMGIICARIKDLSGGKFTVEPVVQPEGAHHHTNDSEVLPLGTAGGVHRPKRKPARSYCSVNFSASLRYFDGRELPGIGGQDACCINAKYALDPDTLVHEFLHTLGGDMIGGRIVPSSDATWRHSYPGMEKDSRGNGWWNWFRAMLTNTWILLPTERQHIGE